MSEEKMKEHGKEQKREEESECIYCIAYMLIPCESLVKMMGCVRADAISAENL